MSTALPSSLLDLLNKVRTGFLTPNQFITTVTQQYQLSADAQTRLRTLASQYNVGIINAMTFATMATTVTQNGLGTTTASASGAVTNLAQGTAAAATQTPDGKPLKTVTITLPDGSKTEIQVADNPDYKEPPPSQTPAPTPSPSSGTAKTVATTAAGLAVTVFGKKIILTISRQISSIAQFGLKAYLAATPAAAALFAAAGGVLTVLSIRKMIEKGPTVVGGLTAAVGATLLYLGAHGLLMHFATGFLASPMAAAIVVAVVVTAAIISALLGERTANQAELKPADVPIWTNGPIMLITAGLALQSAGISFVPNVPPVTYTPTYAALRGDSSRGLLGAKLQSISGNIDPNRFNETAYYAQNHYQPTYVYKAGTGDAPATGPDYVMMVSDGRTSELATVYSINDTFRFASTKPTSKYYIPFFVKNPAGTDNIVNPGLAPCTQSGNLAQAATTLGARGVSALQQASAGCKDGKVLSGS